MYENLIQHAQAYATQHRLRLAERLGFGIHGIIFATEGNPDTPRNLTAVKVHRARDPYDREKSVYWRLREAGISQIRGFNVPRILGHDDKRKILEMTIVTRPFVLDFGGAYLDLRPQFSEEIWAEWEAKNREAFGERWPEVKEILAALEELNIHMVDVSPGNIAFAD